VTRVIKADSSQRSGKVLRFDGQPSARAVESAPSEADTPSEDPARKAGRLPRSASTLADQDRIARLELEAKTLAQQLDELMARSETLQAQAHEQGRAEGARQTGEDTARREALLRRALAECVAAFTTKTGEVEALALQLARSALHRIAGLEEVGCDLLCQTIRHQVARFASDRPATLRVARADFPTLAEDPAWEDEWPQLRIVADRKLVAGDCKLSLELGEVDIGLGGQLERLGDYFDGLAAEFHAPSLTPIPANSGKGITS
jgi:flagellar biosynthesis/type III secretory pathway protein FliH